MESYDISGERELLNAENIEKYIQRLEGKHENIDHIKLSTKTFNEDAAKIIGQEIIKMKNLKKADLSDTISGLSNEDAQKTLEIFVESLKDHDLNLLDLSDNALGPEGVEILKKLIVNKNELTEILLINDGLSADSCKIITNIFKETAPMTLKKLHFHNNMSGNDGAIAISEALSCTPSLEDFRWSCTRTGEEGALALSRALGSLPHLKKLYIGDNYFGESCGDLLYDAIRTMNQLEELILSDISLEDEGIQRVLEALIESHAPITKLNLSLNDIDCDILDVMTEFLSQCPTLKELNLAENQLTSVGAISIIKALNSYCPQLESLNINANEIGSKAAQYIVSICYIFL
ncbi:hypothetical protein WA158_001731 [Blastocystis sp. Blastoise]